MKYKIAILITTFLRDSLLYKTLQTIVDNYTQNCIILIADQGYSSSEKDLNMDYFYSQIPIEYYRIPFDSGLSYSRNFLIQKAKEMNIPYILMSADSIQFLQPYNFQPVIEFLENNDKVGKVGFDLEGSICPWEYLIKLTPQDIRFIKSEEWKEFNGKKYLRIDICRNIFLAKTKSLIEIPYDNEFKLAEHEEQAIRYKEKYLTYWTDTYLFKRISGHNSTEYNIYRKRFREYQKLLKQKFGLSGWVHLPRN